MSIRKGEIVNWEEPPLRRWLNSILNPSTCATYKSAFRAYTQYTGLTATEMVNEAAEDAKLDVLDRQDAVRTRLLGFYQWLKTEYPVKRRRKGDYGAPRKGVSDKFANLRVNAIRSFYGTFGFTYRLKGRYRLPTPKITNRRMIVDPHQVKRMVDHARTPRDRAIILTNFQAGLDAQTLCDLTYGDVRQGLESEDQPLALRNIFRRKTGVVFDTFIGQDAVTAIRAYVRDAERRGIVFNDDTPLFVKERSVNSNIQMTSNLIQIMYREVVIKSGLLDENMNGKAFNILGPHALRESFGSIMINKGVPDTVVDFWLAHKLSEMAKAYKSTQHDDLKRMYADREKFLSIATPSTEVEERLRTQFQEQFETERTLLESNVRKTESELKDDIVRLSRENLAIRHDVSSLTTEKTALEDRIKKVESEKRTLSGKVDALARELTLIDRILRDHEPEWFTNLRAPPRGAHIEPVKHFPPQVTDEQREVAESFIEEQANREPRNAS
jgi:integrase